VNIKAFLVGLALAIVGVIEPLSGRVAAVGRDALNSFQFTVELVNSRGGVLGGKKSRSSVSTTP
jgi:ABC-type branched-subunit amino acid transport system substrate-binding protein